MIDLHELIFNSVHEAQVLDYKDGELIFTESDKKTSFGEICRRFNNVKNEFSQKSNSVDQDVSMMSIIAFVLTNFAYSYSASLQLNRLTLYSTKSQIATI